MDSAKHVSRCDKAGLEAVRQLALILFSSYELEFNFKEGKKRITIAELPNIM